MPGVSDDGEYFKFWDTPLISSEVSGATYLYKPTAMVLNGIFYLWHPVRVNGVYKIHMSEMNFDKVLKGLGNSKSSIS